MRAFDAYFDENWSYLSERTTGRVKLNGERPDGCCRPLTEVFR